MNDTITEITTHEANIKQYEANAKECEQKAREWWTKREQEKLEAARKRSILHDAKVAHAIEGSMAAASLAKEKAEASATEIAAQLEVLKATNERINAKEKSLDELISQATETAIAAAAAKAADGEAEISG